MLDGSGCLTFDVMAWLSEQSIPLIHLDYRGNVVSVIGGAGFATDPDKVRWQTETRNDPERRLAFCCELIAEKLTKSLRTLTEEIPDSPARKVAIARTEVEIHRLRKGQFRSVDEVRLSEALAAAAYFKAWQGIPLAWRNRARCPVPDDWLTTQKRNTIASGGWRSNRNAKHPVNAILNYAYAMVSSQAHVDALANGYDPRRGIMHHDRDDGDALAFVFDLIEPRRPLVDAAVLRFVRRTPLSGADFAVRSDGVCRLAPQLAKVVSQQACEVVSGSLRVARDH
jgi:CRISP-associated protein Cas1